MVTDSRICKVFNIFTFEVKFRDVGLRVVYFSLRLVRCARPISLSLSQLPLPPVLLNLLLMFLLFLLLLMVRYNKLAIAMSLSLSQLPLPPLLLNLLLMFLLFLMLLMVSYNKLAIANLALPPLLLNLLLMFLLFLMLLMVSYNKLAIANLALSKPAAAPTTAAESTADVSTVSEQHLMVSCNNLAIAYLTPLKPAAAPTTATESTADVSTISAASDEAVSVTSVTILAVRNASITSISPMTYNSAPMYSYVTALCERLKFCLHRTSSFSSTGYDFNKTPTSYPIYIRICETPLPYKTSVRSTSQSMLSVPVSLATVATPPPLLSSAQLSCADNAAAPAHESHQQRQCYSCQQCLEM
ncbi:hypothetical protein J6590_036275 [Homalodisca vitripennis]|nr:hypothetical protein J6590_036275 [Homalodisca vitripennis]